jgi:ELWxxDGT repeat protein
MAITRQALRLACAIAAAATIALDTVEPAESKPLVVHRIADINPGSGSAGPASLTVFGDELVFHADDGTTGIEVWGYDGTSVTQIADIKPGAANGLIGPFLFSVFGNELIFTASDGATGPELWGYDGTNVTQVADIDPGSSGSFAGFHGFTVFGGELVFPADDAMTGEEPWRYNGSSVAQVADINPGAGDSLPPRGISYRVDFTAFGNELVFTADDGTTGRELWGYDGTSVTQIADINPGAASSRPFEFVPKLTVFGSELVFHAIDSASDDELWRYDGTSVSRVADINPGAGGSFPKDLTVFGNSLAFSADDGTTGRELWGYDGSSVTQIADIDPGAGGSNPQGLTLFGNEVVFAANDGTHGVELWKTDGTAAGTMMVADINPAGDSIRAGFSPRVIFNGALVFAADDGTHGVELWSYDGTSVARITDINPSGSSIPIGFSFFGDLSPRVFGCELVFAADDGTTGIEPWGLADISACIADLMNDVIAANLQRGISNGLQAKLAAALRALDDGNAQNDSAVIRALRAFIAEIEALLRAGRIDEETAAALIEAAEKLIALLSGSQPVVVIPD